MARKNLKENDSDALVPRKRKLENIIPHKAREDLIYVDPFQFAETVGKEGLIVLPDAYQDDYPLIGRVFSVGPGIPFQRCNDCGGEYRGPLGVEIGDYVLYGALGLKPMTLEVGGVPYEILILRAAMLLGKVEGRWAKL